MNSRFAETTSGGVKGITDSLTFTMAARSTFGVVPWPDPGNPLRGMPPAVRVHPHETGSSF